MEFTRSTVTMAESLGEKHLLCCCHFTRGCYIEIVVEFKYAVLELLSPVSGVL